MTNKEIIQDLNYRIQKSDIIKKLEEDITEGIYDDNPLIDLVLYYQRDIGQLEEENTNLYKKNKYLQEVMKSLGELKKGDMSNDTIRGYVTIAMKNLGYKKEDIEKVMDELHYAFDMVTIEQAEKEYNNPFKYDKEDKNE